MVEHNGKPFTEENVRAITYFGKSTSRDDLVKTGRFGVGFKSVFAFTATPTVISGEEHFQIYGLYRVREHPYPGNPSPSHTHIALPFNHTLEKPDYVEDLMSREKAYSKISERLIGLNMSTLLFTRNILEILWETEGRSGHYLRRDVIDDNSRWTTIEGEERLKKYLVFSRVPQWKNEEHKAVEIAFSADEQDKKNPLSPVDDFLYVLFPTTQETHLKFILNGPYRTNPSREAISEDDSFNLHLMKETCGLMKDVLPQLKEKGLLTAQFLSILPNSNDNLRSFYTPLREAIVETFHEKKLVPTDDNHYACSGDVFQGPAPVREVITREELPFFAGRENVCWAKGVLQNSRSDYFLISLDIQTWGWKELQKALEEKYSGYTYDANDDDDVWLAGCSDSWLQKLYILLADAIRKGEYGEWELQDCLIIRVLKDGKETHVAGSSARFPKKGYRGLPQVKPRILQGKNEQETQKIYDSLVALGISEIDGNDYINRILNTSYGDEPPEITKEKHLHHMKTFIKWWKKEKDASKFKGYTIFRVAGKDDYFLSKDCFLDSPVRKSGLNAIYSKHTIGIPKKRKLWKGYQKLVGEGFCEFAVDCGVEDSLTIKEQSCSEHPNWPDLRKDYHKRGVKLTSTSIDRDVTINGLSALLKMKDRDVNHLIWHTVSCAHRDDLEAEFRPNQQYRTRKDQSSLLIALSKALWIPDTEGHLHEACDLTREQLHPDFKYDNRNGWLDEICFGENARKFSEEYRKLNKQAKDIGFSSADEATIAAEIIKLFKEDGQSPVDVIAQLKANRKKEKPAFPARSSANPERRQERLEDQINGAQEKEYELRTRSVRTTKGTIDAREWLKGNYTNEAGQMICQICQKEMPFKKRDGEYYFEAVEALSKDHFPKELEAQFLALCPLCAAMYYEFIKCDKEAMGALKGELLDSSDHEVPLIFGDLKSMIRFVETHFQDIKTILELEK